MKISLFWLHNILCKTNLYFSRILYKEKLCIEYDILFVEKVNFSIIRLCAFVYSFVHMEM